MEIIVNNKTFPNGLNIIQLETAVGAAMKSFEGSIGKSQDPEAFRIMNKAFFTKPLEYSVSYIVYYVCAIPVS